MENILSTQLKNTILAGIIILLSIFLGYNLLLNYEIKTISEDLKNSFNKENDSRIHFKNSGYNFFEKIYVNELRYYNKETSYEYTYEIENITFKELDLGNKIPRYVKAEISNTDFDTFFRDSSNNTINFDYKYDNDNQIMNFYIIQKIENIGQFEINFNIENVILNTLTDGFLSNNFHLHSFSFDKLFNKIKHIDNINITLNNDEFLKVFTTFLILENPEDRLSFYEYKFSQKNSNDLKEDLLLEINKIKSNNKNFYNEYLLIIEDVLKNNKQINITFNTKALYDYNSYNDFVFDLKNNQENIFNKLNLKIKY